MTVLYIICAVAALLVLLTVFELVYLIRIKPLPDLPDKTDAETFTNHQVIKNTLEYLRKNKIYKNKFFAYFRFLNLTVFKCVD